MVVGRRVNDGAPLALMRGRGLWRVSKQVRAGVSVSRPPPSRGVPQFSVTEKG